MDPVGLTVGLLTTVAALVCKVHEMIAQAEIVGDQFEDLEWEFNRAQEGLECLKTIFETSTLRPADVDEYRNKVNGFSKNLEIVKTQLDQIHGNLKHRSFFKRYAQKRELMDGELARLKTIVVNFNSSLNYLATTYGCLVGNRNHEKLTRIENQLNKLEFQTEKNLQRIRVDIDLNLEYVAQAMQQLQEVPEYSEPLPKYEKHKPMFILTDKDTPGAVTPYTTPSTPRVILDATPRAPLGPGPLSDEAFRASGWYVTWGLQGAEEAQNEYWNTHALQQASAV